MIYVIELPPAEFLNECFSYNESSGSLIWKQRPPHHFKTGYAHLRFNKLSAGKEAGIKMFRKGGEDPLCLRVKFRYMGEKLFPSVHRIIFCMKGINVPDGILIDHRDGNPFNNAWINLRLASHQQNSQNKRNERTRQHDLPKGVHHSRAGKFRANVQFDGTVKHIGTFDTPKQAKEARDEFCRRIHGEFFRP